MDKFSEVFQGKGKLPSDMKSLVVVMLCGMGEPGCCVSSLEEWPMVCLSPR